MTLLLLVLLWLAPSSALACQAAAGTAQAGAAPRAFVGAHLIPIAGPEIPDGTLVLAEGKITAVGARRDVTVPDGAEVIDARGMVLMPGLICTHSHVGGGSGGDDSAPIQPDVRVMDSINVRSAGLHRARAGGLTTLNIMPGSGHLLSGQTIYVKLRDGNTIEDLAIRDEDGGLAGGMKLANGTNSQRDPPFPGTRSRSAALIRQQFIKAQEYQRKLQGEEKPPRDLGLEALVEVLEGKRIVHHHTHRHDDILTVLRMREEFGFRVVLHHVSEAWKVADEIAAAGVPCSLIMIDSPGGKLEARDFALRNGAVCEQAGIDVAFHTDDPITDSRWFLRSAGLAVRAGMGRAKALEALTLAGARMLDLADRTGSLEAGKDADLVLLSGDPLSVYTQVLQTWVEGEKVFDRDDPEDRLVAVGGYGAGEDRLTQLCCFGDLP